MFEIGSTLREARVRRKLTLQQVEEDTKIRVKYLRALEEEDFEALPADTYARIGKWMRHTHLKDSVPLPQGKKDEDRRYVLTGTGQVPVQEQVRVLAKGGYPGFYSFEWEKGWHPEIEEPEVAFPHYAKVMGGWLDEFGVKRV